jgi:hypothetical protein
VRPYKQHKANKNKLKILNCVKLEVGMLTRRRISNISKKIILFGQNYDTSLTLFYPFYQKKKQIFCIFLFLKIKTTHNAFITKHVPMQKYLATNNHTKTHSQNILNHSRKEK